MSPAKKKPEEPQGHMMDDEPEVVNVTPEPEPAGMGHEYVHQLIDEGEPDPEPEPPEPPGPEPFTDHVYEYPIID